MKKHKLCKLFPEITGQDFAAFVADIKANGLRDPIITLDDQILDGQNRLNACMVAGIEPRYKPFTGDDPLAFVISQNLDGRRHLTNDQRAAIAAEISKMKPGRIKGADSAPLAKTVDQAAADLKVNPRQVQIAKKVKRESPEAFKKVKAGKMSLNAAHEQNHPRKPKPEPSPLRGVDTAKLDAPEPEAEWLEPEAPEAAPAAPLPNPVLPPSNSAVIPATEAAPVQVVIKATVAGFTKIVSQWETLINATCEGNQKEREKYGVIVNALAGRLLNPVKKEFNPYTS